MMEQKTGDSPAFVILGASLDTGNLGVSALLASTVKCLHRVLPDARLQLLQGARNPRPQAVPLLGGEPVALGRVGVRCNKTVWRPNHLVRLLCSATFARCLPGRWRNRWLRRNPYLNAIVSARAVMDITGGDSFSDIYGTRRLILGSLSKFLILLCGVDLVLLPQTYGPFKGWLARGIARAILSHAAAVYSRDREGVERIRQLMGRRKMQAQPQFCPDVAFVLDPIPPDQVHVLPGPLPAKRSKVLVGFNVSGLLWNGGYTQNNMFGLRADYPSLVRALIAEVLRNDNTAILLVPHVFPANDLAVESDPQACRQILEELGARYPGRLFCLDGPYNQSEIKWIIGQCDFFLGSRMHACIAAMSQGIPAVGLAYSKKFAGVFDSVGVGDCAVDLRTCDGASVCTAADAIFSRRQGLREHLARTIPQAQDTVLNVFQGIEVKAP